MTAASSQDDGRRLRAIRERLSRLPAGEWLLAYEGGEAAVVREDAAARMQRVAVFTAETAIDEQAVIADAAGDLRFLVGLVDRAAAKLRSLVGPEPDAPPARKAKDYAAEAAMFCQRADFQRFLGGLIANDDTPAAGVAIGDVDRAAQRLRTVLGIGSRRALNTDRDAAERWRRLKDDFFEMKRGRG